VDETAMLHLVVVVDRIFIPFPLIVWVGESSRVRVAGREQLGVMPDQLLMRGPVPAAGATFAGWSGAGCSGTSTCTLAMSSDQAVTATFDPAPPATLTGTLITPITATTALEEPPVLSALRISPSKFALAGRLVGGRWPERHIPDRALSGCREPARTSSGARRDECS
jgi:hypothetical protein